MKIPKIILAAIIAATACTATTAQSLADEVIADIRKELAPDKRQAVFEVTSRLTDSDAYSPVLLKGKISEAATHQALLDALTRQGLKYIDSITVMPDDQWAQAKIAVACMRTKPGHAAEMATQAVMGTPLRVLENDGDWWRVQTPDGYIGWTNSSSISRKTADEMAAWRAADRYVVTSLYQVRAYRSPKAKGPREMVTDLVNGSIVVDAGSKPQKGRREIVLPDGRTGWVNQSDITPISDWAAQNFDADKILDMAYSMEGQPYLWGGTSTKSLDCSGLAKVSYLSNGIILMRDASQQALTGKRIEAADWRTCEAGDLLFFGTRSGRVTHVAIYDHDGNYVHSSGRVKRNSVDPEADSYLTTPFLHAVRIKGNEGTKGITYARNHPWYFDQN